MSRIWTSEEMGAAERLGSWNDMATPAARPGRFRALYAEEARSRAWNVTHPGHPTHVQEDIPEEDPVELAAQEAFVQGFKEGERVTREALEADDRARLALADAMRGATLADEGALASLLSHAVMRLLGQIVGEVAIDETLLQSRCAAVAACIDSDTDKAVLEVNPEDLALIDGTALGVALNANADLPRGAVRLATSEGWVEDGPDVRLSRLKALLDGMEGRA